MKVEEWLSGLEYDSDGQEICKTDNNAIVLEIRGWAHISEHFPSREQAALFQDEVGKFVVEAINEKLENDKNKIEIWNKVEKSLHTSLIDKINETFEEVGLTKSRYKFQIDNLDWCILVKKDNGEIVVENEHSTQFPLEGLKENELHLALQNLW